MAGRRDREHYCAATGRFAICHFISIFSPDTLRKTFEASALKTPAIGRTWDPSVVIVSLQNVMRRTSRPTKSGIRRCPDMLWMLLTAPLALLEISNGPVLRFWAQKPA